MEFGLNKAETCEYDTRGVVSVKTVRVRAGVLQLLTVISFRTKPYKNSSGDEIANLNFYAVRPEATRIRRNNAK